MADDFSERYGDLLAGSYDCVDRIVLNAFFSLGHNPGGFRVWWRRWHDGGDADLDNTHLMRLAGRFTRRVKAWAGANGVPVIYCKAGERKHEIAEQYLAEHTVGRGVFMILVARAKATVWDVHRSADGAVLGNLAKKSAFVNHFSFHIMDPQWGHMTIKMSGHPPSGAQIILNGHEYVAVAAQTAGIGFTKEGNCFTAISDPARLAQIAETLSDQTAIGRLRQVCERWIYSACLCFGLDLAEQTRSGFGYGFSVYQAEYSRNLLFKVGAQMEDVFNTVIDRTRSRLDMPTVRTLFGAKTRPHHNRAGGPPDLSIVIEKPRYDLIWFRLNFGLLTVKAYTKGEHLLRFEATVHNTKELHCGKILDKFPDIITRLTDMTERFCTALDCVDTTFIADHILDELPLPSQLGRTRLGGVDLNKPRTRTALAAALALTPAPNGFTVADFTAQVHAITGPADTGYTTRQAAYDLRKLRGKHLIQKPGRSRRYHLTPQATRTITALLTLQNQIIAPILAGVRSPRMGRKPAAWTPIDRDYEKIRIDMQTLFCHLGIQTTGAAA
jgi:hypothetical protein